MDIRSKIHSDKDILYSKSHSLQDNINSNKTNDVIIGNGLTISKKFSASILDTETHKKKNNYIYDDSKNSNSIKKPLILIKNDDRYNSSNNNSHLTEQNSKSFLKIENREHMDKE